jgi:hypothetical protein
MGIDFTFYRVLCTTPPDLESERLAFESAVAQFVEEVSMPDGVLFAAASLRPPIQAAVQKAAIEDNIRNCEFFIQVFGERWPDPVFADFVRYSLECAADSALGTRKATQPVTRQVCVFFRNPEAADAPVRQFRETLAATGQCDLREFSSAQEFAEQLHQVFCAWYAPLKPPSA